MTKEEKIDFFEGLIEGYRLQIVTLSGEVQDKTQLLNDLVLAMSSAVELLARLEKQGSLSLSPDR